MHHHQIVQDIRNANPYRTPDNIRRRLLKILEEIGEASEAYLSRTGQGNYKNKTWDDYREEAIDTLIVLLDVTMTEFEGLNFPPAALLPNHLLDAMQSNIDGFNALEDRKFAVVRAVARADEHLQKNDLMRFHGAMARGIKAAAEMVYARYDDSNAITTKEIDAKVYEVVTRKLAKWTVCMTGSTPSHSDFPDEDIKSHMEMVEERHA